ncbi:MAG: trypsin-like serine peptidase [Vicinamibacteraceae bacterium]
MQTLLCMGLAVVFTILAVPATMAQTKVGDVRAHAAESPHPYPAGSGGAAIVWHEEVQSPGATFIRLHFEDLEIGAGDALTVSSPDGLQSWTLTDRGPRGSGDVWSFAIDGDTAVVRIHGGSSPSFGYRITELVHGTGSPVGTDQPVSPLGRPQESVCGTDGLEPVACHMSEAGIAQTQRSVAQLLYQSGGDVFACTGTLVRGAVDSLLLTNNHCMSSQAEVSTLQATFGHQLSACSNGVLSVGMTYAGDLLVSTSTSLDYSLVTLQGNPEASWGELLPTAADADVGTTFWLTQHPAGGPKDIGYWEDASRTSRCKVASSAVTIEALTPGSQMEYACDTTGGSSGSPLVSAETNRIVGLHHLGALPPPSPCLNAATMMRFICEDAGNLLGCDQPSVGHARYFAEGAEGFFQTFDGVFNPHPTLPAFVSVEAFTESGRVARSSFWLGPRENQIVWLRDLIGDTSAASTVSSNIPVVTDRYMRWGMPHLYGSSMERSVPEPSQRWSFGEGATGPFDLFYLLQNPRPEDARVTITYLREGGGPIRRTYTVAAFSRYTVYVNAEPGLGAANVSAEINATVPIIAERSMYLNTGGVVFGAGTTGSGATSLSDTWYFAEGATGFFDEFLLFGNARTDPLHVTAEYLLPDGQVVPKEYTVPAEARLTVWVNEDPRLADTAVAVRLRGDAPFIAERAMWWPHGSAWSEAHVSLGSRETGTVWASAYAGQNCDGEDSFVLISNGGATPGRIRMTAYFVGGGSTAKELDLAGNARLTVSAAQDLGIGCGAAYSILVESLGASPAPIAVEMSRYFSSGQPLEGGAAALATKVQ